MKFLLLLICFLLPFSEKIKVWKEKRGIAVVEAEHIQIRNDLHPYWVSEKLVDGYSGTGYVMWGGASYIKADYSDLYDERILTFYVSVSKEGVYYVKIKGLCLDEWESRLLVRINGKDWHNYTIANQRTFGWDLNGKKDLCGAFMQLGYHKIEIAAIDAGFMLDKLAVVHQDEFSEEGWPDRLMLETTKESRSEYLPSSHFKQR